MQPSTLQSVVQGILFSCLTSFDHILTEIHMSACVHKVQLRLFHIFYFQARNLFTCLFCPKSIDLSCFDIALEKKEV